MAQAQFLKRMNEILDTAASKGNVSDSALLVAYGRIMQAASDKQISRAEAKALTDRFGPAFSEKYDDAIEVAFSGLTGSQLEALAVD